MSVTFRDRMRKSYRVDVSQDVKFNNERGTHVETPTENLTGKTFTLGKRSQRVLRGNVAVMYEVIGVMNGKYPAHLTVYFGSGDHANEY